MADSLSVGRLQAALASATNDVTVTAANINFDFALVKYEAPPEYRPLLQTMSNYRRTEAESGSQHVTARRLGALFDGLCPNTPNLISKFGQRAAEISIEAAKDNQHKRVENWIFSEYTGIDSTSLWAAATSRQAALPVYLLACMLARVWSETEATSLWVEIVAERRREIVARFSNDEPLPFALTAAAAQQEIPREELAKWDASARAWLKTADVVKTKERKQFLLIADNISIPVNSETQPFKSIIPAWISALESMEKIITGAPHAVMDGSVLLGISAWHIYPDMDVFSTASGSKSVEMKDVLVQPGGVVSLGLSDSGARSSRGVYWSLSLANHRFYGRAIRKSSEVNGDRSRLEFAELQVVVLGAILSKWKVPQLETNSALRFMMQLAAALPSKKVAYSDRWIDMITNSAEQYFDDEESKTPLISLGRRRSNFIPANRNEQAAESPYFGLTEVECLLNLVESPENRIELLRRLASRIENLERTPALIVFNDGKDRRFSDQMHLATAFPVRMRSGRPLFDSTTESETSKAKRTHCRWLGRDRAFLRPAPVERVCEPSLLPFRHLGRMVILQESHMVFTFLFGDEDSAAVYVLSGGSYRTDTSQLPSIIRDNIIWCLQQELLQPRKLRSYLGSLNTSIIVVLTILAFASDVYSALSPEGASISPRILTAPFKTTMISWEDAVRYGDNDIVELARQLWSSPQTRWRALALIAYFETGNDISATGENIDNFLGISSGDSIYVPSRLLHDPNISVPAYKFNRLLGNLGRPGLTILTSPEQPEARDIDLGSWRQVAGKFDGSQIDYFGNTSLHLSFTDWSVPIYRPSAIGERDSEATHAEAAVSVRDAGRWVADINIIAAFNNVDISQLPEPSKPCSHTKPTNPPPHLMPIETWDQILDCSEGALVTRSSGNWVSRVAIVAVLAHHCKLESKRIVICPRNVCWNCIEIPDQNVIYVY
ncbi:hypothetical protein F5Y13DRAFT_196976 [Hypoxylon sp. FL1857]|nr:hypothetical protein F5Y13DRAFT_196976 [Hypoxylon sp. FL1857]